jgi:hypothetical protein
MAKGHEEGRRQACPGEDAREDPEAPRFQGQVTVNLTVNSVR